jgi:exonuclease SbcD
MGATLGTEKMMSIGQEHALPVSNVANPAFDYIALGHIHKGQVLSTSPPAVYAGSLERIDFGDEADEKGFYVVDIETGASDRKASSRELSRTVLSLKAGKRRVAYEFHPVKGRHFVTIGITIEPEDINPTTTVLQAIGQRKSEIEDAIVRLQLTLPSEIEGLLNDTEIRNALKDAHYCTISRDIKREARLRLGKWSAEEVTPLDALKLYLESKKVSPERMELLLEYGQKLIEGETVFGD